MQLCNLIWMFTLLVQHAHGEAVVPECITITELNRAMRILCLQQKGNQTLWNNVIQCHRPISDEFMRSSAEALCPVPKHVQDPTDSKYSIAEVYLNICGMVEGSPAERQQGYSCLIDGSPTTRSHEEEVKVVKETWGKDVPCQIGICITDLLFWGNKV